MRSLQRSIRLSRPGSENPWPLPQLRPKSFWTRYHRIGAGVDAGPADVPPIIARGTATLHLYQETARLLWPILEPPHREVIEQSLKVIGEAGGK